MINFKFMLLLAEESIVVILELNMCHMCEALITLHAYLLVSQTCLVCFVKPYKNVVVKK